MTKDNIRKTAGYCFRILFTVTLLCVLGVMMESATPSYAAGQTFKGKNNWLFYKAQGDGSTMYDYRGINHYSSSGLRRAANNLLAAEKRVNQKGAEFVVYFAPNKETIYSQYMPDRIRRVTTYTRYDQLYDYLTLNTGLNIAYPKDELLAQRDNYELYYPNDTHWNPKGQFIGVQELMDITDGKKISIEDVRFKTINHYNGDLNHLSYGQYHYNCKNYRLVGKMRAEDKSKLKVFIVGDSFGHRMANMAKKFYKKATFSHINNFRMSMVDGYDVVVWETVERYQDRFAWVNLANR